MNKVTVLYSFLAVGLALVCGGCPPVIDPPAEPSVLVEQASAQVDPASDESVHFTVTFSTDVTGFDAEDIILGGTAGATTAVVTGGPAVYEVVVSGMTGDGTVTLSIAANAAQDAAGNSSLPSVSMDNSVMYDCNAPTVTVEQADAQADPTAGATIHFTATFSEAVTGLADADVTLAGTAGATTAVVTGGPTVYDIAVSGMTGDGTVVVSIAEDKAMDAAGNTNLASTSTDNSVTVDTTGPTVTVEQAVAQDDPTNGATVHFTATFTSDVTGFAGADVTLAGTAGATTAAVTGGPAVYDIAVSGMTCDGTVIVSIAADKAMDAAGNKNLASISTDNSVTVDMTGPTVTVEQAVSQDDPTNDATVHFTATFSSSVTGFEDADVTLAGTAGATTAVITGGPAVYDIAVSGMTSGGTVIASTAGDKAQDAAGNGNAASTSTDNSVTFDSVAPTVTVEQAAAQADPTNDATIHFTATFSSSVTGLADADVTLAGTAGATTAVVTGGPTVYDIAVSGMTGNGTVICSIAADKAQDAAGNGNLPSSSTDNSVTYDTTGQTVTVEQAAAQDDPTNDATIHVTATFSDAVTGFEDADVTLAGTAGATTAVVTGGPTVYDIAISGMTGDGTVTVSIDQNKAVDSLGNGNVASTSTDNTVTYDATAPTVTITHTGQEDPSDEATIDFVATFSEDVTGFDETDVTLAGTAGATTVVVTPVDAKVYNIAVTGMTGDGTVIVSIAGDSAEDAAGNGNTASAGGDGQVTYDATAPTVTVEQAVGQTDPSNSTTLHFTATFNEDVTGLVNADVTLAGTAGATTAVVTGGPAVYDIAVSGMTSGGTVIVSIAADKAQDAAGNGNEASTSADNFVTFDTVAPTVTVEQAAAQADPTNGATINFTATFNSNVTGLADADITLAGTAGATTATVTGGPAVYNIAVTGMTGDGTVIVSIAADKAQDAAGNGNLPSSSTDNTVTYDTTGPTVTVERALAQDDPTNDSTIHFTATFSSSVTGFVDADVTLAGTAGATTAVVTGGPVIYNIAVTGMTGDGTVIVSIAANKAQDAANNNNLASTSTDNSVLYDTTAPTVTVEQAAAQDDPSNDAAIHFTATFSEDVTGLVDVDVTLAGTAGATTAVVTGGPAVYDIAVSGMTGNGTVLVSIGANKAKDASDNNNAASTSVDNSVTYDGVAPTVTVEQAVGQDDPTNGATINFTATFSENVTGFVDADVTLAGTAGATTTVVTGGPMTYNIAVSGMTGDGTVIASIAVNKAIDAAGNNNAASTSADGTVTYDTTAPTVTIEQAAGQEDPSDEATIDFVATFNEDVTGFTNADVTLAGTAGATTVVVTPVDARVYNIAVSGMTGDGTVLASIAVNKAIDAAGNDNAASTSVDGTVTYDTTAPTVTVEQAVAQDDPTNDTTIHFTATFNEDVTGFTNADVTLAGTAGATTVVVTGGPLVYDIAVSGMTGDGTVLASIAVNKAIDAAGNNNAASTSVDNSVTYDATVPTVTITHVGQEDPSDEATIDFVATFSEDVTGFTNADVTLAGTAGATTVVVTPVNASVYNIAVTGMTGDGTVIVSIAADKAIDTAGNNNTASAGGDQQVTYDVMAPTVTVEQAAGQEDPSDEATIDFVATFSEDVTGFTNADVTLAGTAGATTVVVTPVDARVYNIAVTGMTGDGTVLASIAVNKAIDAAGNNNAASTSTDNSVTYDGTAPTVTVEQAVGQADPTGDVTIHFTATFSENVTGFADADVTLAGTAGATTAVVTGGPAVYDIAVSGMTAGGTVIASVDVNKAIDASGNGNAASTSVDGTVTYAPAAPAVTVEQAAAQADPAKTSPIHFTATFSENVTGFDENDVTIAGTANATTAVVTGGPAVYDIAISGMAGDGTVIVSIGAGVCQGAAANANAASTSADNTVTYDATAPTVTVEQAVGQADPANGSPIHFTATFSENVTGLVDADVTLAGTAGATTAVVTGGPKVYNIAVSGMTSDGTVIASIAASKAIDAAGNNNDASTSVDGTVTYDTGAPTVTVEQAAGQEDPSDEAAIDFTVTFSEAVTGFVDADVTIGGTANATTATVTGGPTVYNVAVSGMANDGTVIISIAGNKAIDAANNNNQASTSVDNTVTYDATAPTVTVEQAAAQDDPTNDAAIHFTATFSEAVTGFVDADVTIAGTANATTATVTGGPIVYDIAISGMANDGTVIVSIAINKAQDPAGNNNAASTSVDGTVTYDATVPTVAIEQAVGQDDPTNEATIDFTATFSEAVTGFTDADVTLTGTAGATTVVITGGPTVYNVAVSGMTSNGSVKASIVANAAQDAAGNLSVTTASTDRTVTYSVVTPTVTVEQAVGQDDPTNDATIHFTATFSEAVTGFTDADVTIAGTANATTATVTGGPVVYDIAISGMANDGTVIVTIGAGCAINGAGNGNQASTSTDNTVTYDGTAPTVTSVTRVDSTQFDVLFSEPMKEATVENLAAYAVSGGLTVTGATLDVDRQTVHVTVDADPIGEVVIVKVTVKDEADNVLAAQYTSGVLW